MISVYQLPILKWFHLRICLQPLLIAFKNIYSCSHEDTVPYGRSRKFEDTRHCDSDSDFHFNQEEEEEKKKVKEKARNTYAI